MTTVDPTVAAYEYEHDVPMQATNIAAHIENIGLRMMAPYQWVREAQINAKQENAKHIWFTTDYGAVERHGVYRRVIADDGPGIPLDGYDGPSAHPIIDFFAYWGGGRKTIGGAHDNYGVGIKAGLLPWNQAGLAVISLTEDDPEGSMIMIRKNPNGEYALRSWWTKDGEDDDDGAGYWWNVVRPAWDPEVGVNWAESIPKQTREAGHGLVLVCLGNALDEDTVRGNPAREHGSEHDHPGLAITKYLQGRFWDFGGTQPIVAEYRGRPAPGSKQIVDKAFWPKRETVMSDDEPGAVVFSHRGGTGGLRAVYDNLKDAAGGSRYQEGVVPLSDSTNVRWVLLDEKPGSGWGLKPFVAALYKDELFDKKGDSKGSPAVFRSWGISENPVRERLWLIAEPPLADEHGRGGVQTTIDRSSLVMHSDEVLGGTTLPWDRWSEEFRNNMPEPILAAIKAARAKDTPDEGALDEEMAKRLADKFSARWKASSYRVDKRGRVMTDPTLPGTKSRPGPKPGPNPKPNPNPSPIRHTRGTPVAGVNTNGSTAASPRKKAVGLPEAKWYPASDFQSGQFAEWNDPSDANPSGLCKLNKDHPVLKQDIEYHLEQYVNADWERVATDVKAMYRLQAIAVCAHVEKLAGTVSPKELKELRDPWALTTALLGFFALEPHISTRLGGRYGARVRAVS